MKKKLFTLLLCAFSVLGAKAQMTFINEDLGFGFTDDGLTIICKTPGALKTFMETAAQDDSYAVILNAMKSGGGDDGYTSLLLSGKFSEGDLLKVRDEKIGTLTVQTVDLSDADFGTETYSFSAWEETLTRAILPTSSNVTSIPQGCLVDCSLVTSIEIPANIKTIEAHAFDNAGLTEVTIPSTLEKVKAEAFVNCVSIKDVYVPATRVEGGVTYPVCELQAFDYRNLVNQTVVGGTQGATLHFPDDDFEYYCGSWKENMIYTQENLDIIKNLSNVPAGYDYPNNGWQQFAQTGSPREIIVKGSLLRTFSDEENYVAPTGIKVYRATAYTEAQTGGSLTLKEITYSKGGSTAASGGVPGSTGVILKSTDEYTTTGNSMFYLSMPDENDSFNYYPWNEESGHNYLYPTLLGGEEISSADWSSGVVTFRNFGFKASTESFLRLKSGKLAANKAYLKLPADITRSLAEVNNGPAADFSDTSAGAKIAIVFEDADLSQTTSLKNVDEIVKNAHDNSFYTLEGVKVNAPSTKGIYVHNGKKVVIK